jgi:hypothetical protein
MRSALDPASASAAISIGLDYEAAGSAFRLAAGVPTSSVESLWAGASAWKRVAARSRGFVAGLDLAGNAFFTRDRSVQPAAAPPPIIPGPFSPPLEHVADRYGHALAGQLLPVVGYEHPRVQVHARAGVSRYTARFGDVSTDRTVRLADVQASLMPTTALAVMPVVRHFEPDGADAATYAGASVVMGRASANAWASVGRWLGSGDFDVPWAVGASARVHRRATLQASARRDTFDPLYVQPPQTSWNIGVSIQVGGPLGPPAPPVPAVYADGRATIELPLSDAGDQPAIAGDFNGWKPAPMQRSDDAWTYTVALEPGVYNYAFVRSDGTWFVPESVPGRREDGMGGHVAVLVVP